jgi:hypothetical protein
VARTGAGCGKHRQAIVRSVTDEIDQNVNAVPPDPLGEMPVAQAADRQKVPVWRGCARSPAPRG